MDLARPMFAQIQPITDLEEFSGNYGTGNKIFNDPEFVDYMTGCEEPRVGYTLLNFPNPDCSNILTRTYSTYTGNGNTSKQVEQKRSDDKLNDNILHNHMQFSMTPTVFMLLSKKCRSYRYPNYHLQITERKHRRQLGNHLPTIIPTIQMIYFPRMKDYNPAMALQIIVRKEIGHHPGKEKTTSRSPRENKSKSNKRFQKYTQDTRA